MSEKVSSSIVVQSEDAFLLVQENKQGQDVLGLVGGTMGAEDFGSPEACALREGEEESGKELILTGLLRYTRSPIPGSRGGEHERFFFSGILADELADGLLPNAAFYSYKDIKRLRESRIDEQVILRSNGTWEAIRAARKTEPMPIDGWVDLRARADARADMRQAQAAQPRKQQRRKRQLLAIA